MCRWRRWPASCCSSPGTWASGTSSRGCATSAVHYRTMLLGTFVLTVIFDLTVAVQVGLVLACVFFIYRMSTLFRVEPHPTAPPAGRVCRLYGSLFFGAVGKLEGSANTCPADPRGRARNAPAGADRRVRARRASAVAPHLRARTSASFCVRSTHNTDGADSAGRIRCRARSGRIWHADVTSALAGSTAAVSTPGLRCGGPTIS